jgi:hypothetical protein
MQDDTAEATLGLWGTSTLTPLHTSTVVENLAEEDTIEMTEGWKSGETVLLLQAPDWKIGRSVCDHNMVAVRTYSNAHRLISA